MKSRLSKFSGFFALLSAAIIYGSFGLFIRELDTMFGGYTQIFARTGIAFLIAVGLVLFYKNKITIPNELRLKMVVFVVAFPIAIILFTFAVNQEKIASVVFLLYAGSILSSLVLGSTLLKEKITWIKWLSIILVFVGLGIFADPSGNLEISTGLILGFLAGIFEGITNYGRKDLKSIPRNTLLTYQYFTGAIIALALAFATGEEFFKEFSVSALIVLIIFSIGLIVLGNLLIYGFQHYDVNIGSIVLASEILFAAFLSYLFLSEIPTTNELIGGVVIFIAASISSLDRKWLDKKLKINKITTGS